ncbi:myogenesis-regulating glycosidase-like [Ptychodera flava]|uniref:myogenesis-regulating glycosidase-like n=1 Tax=Ptychodera flava TaxID=63121 RepID=UPI003969BFC7
MAAPKVTNSSNLYIKVILGIIVVFTLSLLTWYQIPCSSGSLGPQENRQDQNTAGIHTLIVGNLILDAISGQFVVKNRSHTERLRVTYGIGMSFEEGFTECDYVHLDNDDVVDTACMKVENKIKLVISHSVYDSIDCYDIEWTSLACDVIPMDCLHMADAHWFGGSENFFQHWPIETVQMPMHPSVTTRFGSIMERYWVNCRGVGVKVNDFIPLHTSANNDDQMLCLKSAYDSKLYNIPDDTYLKLKYQVCLGNNIKTTHQFMAQKHFDRPDDVPDENLFRYPIWSTLARYRTDINQSRVLQLADEVSSNWFPKGQLHIDNSWSSIYGDFEFDSLKFPNARSMIDRLHSMGFSVSVWVTPFASLNSKAFPEGLENEYWIKDGKGTAPAVVSWYHSNMCTVLDVTNADAVEWFTTRLEQLRDNVGIDTFKFGAGEVYYLPQSYTVQHRLRTPNEYSTRYVHAASRMGDQIEVQTAHRTQKLPIFVKLYDRFGRWGYDNGLKSIIPASLLAGILGYPFVLPGMIGGNGAEREETGEAVLPERELYIRWVQLAAYLPVMTFSICPWEYNAEVFNIAKEMVHVHETVVTPIMLRAASEAVETGTPIIRPLWWIAPDDTNALKSDDQFLVGDDLMVAPVLNKGERERDIYLPPGKWRDGLRGDYLEGGRWLRDYKVKLLEIATFTREIS